MSKVAYLHVEPDGCFTFHRPDGSQVDVDAAKGYSTDDPGDIAYLDSVPFVKRAGKTGGGKGA